MRPLHSTLLRYKTGLIHFGLLIATVALWFWGEEQLAVQQHSLLAAQAQRQAMDNKMQNIAQEEQTLAAGENLLKHLGQRGWLDTEDRMAWMEALQRLENELKLHNFRWHISPQGLAPAHVAQVTGDFQVVLSTLHFTAQVRHEPDFIALMSHIKNDMSAFVRPEHCVLKRNILPDSPDSLYVECDVQLITFRQRRQQP